jgi:hypothetical protein
MSGIEGKKRITTYAKKVWTGRFAALPLSHPGLRKSYVCLLGLTQTRMHEGQCAAPELFCAAA